MLKLSTLAHTLIKQNTFLARKIQSSVTEPRNRLNKTLFGKNSGAKCFASQKEAEDEEDSMSVRYSTDFDQKTVMENLVEESQRYNAFLKEREKYKWFLEKDLELQVEDDSEIEQYHETVSNLCHWFSLYKTWNIPTDEFMLQENSEDGRFYIPVYSDLIKTKSQHPLKEISGKRLGLEVVLPLRRNLEGRFSSLKVDLDKSNTFNIYGQQFGELISQSMALHGEEMVAEKKFDDPMIQDIPLWVPYSMSSDEPMVSTIGRKSIALAFTSNWWLEMSEEIDWEDMRVERKTWREMMEIIDEEGLDGMAINLLSPEEYLGAVSADGEELDLKAKASKKKRKSKKAQDEDEDD